MKKFELTTNLCPFIDVGMYQGDLSPESVIDLELVNDSSIIQREYWNYFNFDQYKNEILKILKEDIYPVFVAQIKDCIFNNEEEKFKVEFVSIRSPNYYNYKTDVLYWDLLVDDPKEFIKILKSLLYDIGIENFQNFLKAEHSSYSGYISFVPTDIDDFFMGLDDHNEIEVGIALGYILFNIKDTIDYQSLLMVKISDNIYNITNNSSDFIADSDLIYKMASEYSYSNIEIVKILSEFLYFEVSTSIQHDKLINIIDQNIVHLPLEFSQEVEEFIELEKSLENDLDRVELVGKLLKLPDDTYYDKINIKRVYDEILNIFEYAY